MRRTRSPMHRFFVAGPLAAGARSQIDTLAPQLMQVLRLRLGDELCCWTAAARSFTAGSSAWSAAAARRRCWRPTLRGRAAAVLTLYQCSLKQDKFEWVLQKGTELGVAVLCPSSANAASCALPRRCCANIDRWQAIIREAAEQCGRARLPQLAPPSHGPRRLLRLQGRGFLPWEGAQGSSHPVQHAAISHAR